MVIVFVVAVISVAGGSSVSSIAQLNSSQVQAQHGACSCCQRRTTGEDVTRWKLLGNRWGFWQPTKFENCWGVLANVDLDDLWPVDVKQGDSMGKGKVLPYITALPNLLASCVECPTVDRSHPPIHGWSIADRVSSQSAINQTSPASQPDVEMLSLHAVRNREKTQRKAVK